MADADRGSWPPLCDLRALRLRAECLRRVREFFAARGVMEVETPVLSRAGIPDPNLASFSTVYAGPGAPPGGQRLYLHTSPEFPMKRLLASGSGCIYQVARVFRDGEAGHRHNPEFTMLEWYRVGFDHHCLMGEVEELVRYVLSGERDLQPAERLGYGEAFLRHAGVDPFVAAPRALRQCLRAHGLHEPDGLPADDPGPWLDLILTHLIEPKLGRDGLTFLHDYPPAQASLARIRPGPPPVGERFEAYLDGIELANGFNELGDAIEQRRRFQADNAARVAAGMETVPLDENLLASLRAGLPACAGVALGFDRLLMLALGASGLGAVLAFPIDRA